MIKVVFIDYMGTLKEDTNSQGKAAIVRISERSAIQDVNKTFKIWQEGFNRLINESYQQTFLTQDDIALNLLRMFEKQYGLKDDIADLLKILQHSWVSSAAFPDTLPFLQNCPLPVFILSNSYTQYVSDGMAYSNLSPYAGIVYGDMVRAYKPRPEIFEKGLEVAGCQPAEAIHIGDSFESDYLGAMNAGMRGIWLNRNGRPVPEGVEAVSDLLQVLTILEA